jgi:hypothetical protein
MPPEDASQNRGHKFPFIASEIFNCEIHALLDKFFVKDVEASKEEDKEGGHDEDEDKTVDTKKSTEEEEKGDKV